MDSTFFTTHTLYLLYLILFFSVSTTTITTAAAEADVHDLLSQYNLPRGLIPDNVESYTVSTSGSFSLKLKSPCYVHFDTLVYYDKEVKGQLSYGSVTDVSGIQAKKLFVWLPVTGMKVDDDDMIDFFVGYLSEKLPAQQFQEVPVCQSKAAFGGGFQSDDVKLTTLDSM